jgi:lysophospholipase L1-like esterase
MRGDNDLAAGKSPQQVAQDFQTLVEKIRPAFPDAPIAFISIKPCPARWKIVDKVKETNRLIEQYAAKQKNVRYIDIVPLMLTSNNQPRKELFRADGLHMNRQGYELWVPVIARFIQ